MVTYLQIFISSGKRYYYFWTDMPQVKYLKFCYSFSVITWKSIFLSITQLFWKILHIIWIKMIFYNFTSPKRILTLILINKLQSPNSIYLSDILCVLLSCFALNNFDFIYIIIQHQTKEIFYVSSQVSNSLNKSLKYYEPW